jgi:uncharacterized membrane protein
VDDEDFSEDLAALGAVEALPGRAMTATERTHKRRRKMAKPKSSRRSQRTPGPAVRAAGTKRPDRSCGRWLGLGDWGMGEIFHFAFMRRRVRHGALTMRLRSHVRSAVKTASWRAFAAVDTFGLVWLFSGHDTTHAIAAAGAVVGVEAITKSFLYFAHERLWEAPLLSYLKMTG